MKSRYGVNKLETIYSITSKPLTLPAERTEWYLPQLLLAVFYFDYN